MIFPEKEGTACISQLFGKGVPKLKATVFVVEKVIGIREEVPVEIDHKKTS
jgi:hypothetical protein